MGVWSGAGRAMRENWHNSSRTIKNRVSSKHAILCLDICIHCEMITIIKLLTYSYPHKFFVWGVRSLEIYCFGKFQDYDTLLVTLVIVLYIRSSEPTHLITNRLYCLSNLSSFPHPSGPVNHHSKLCCYKFDFLYSTYK